MVAHAIRQWHADKRTFAFPEQLYYMYDLDGKGGFDASSLFYRLHSNFDFLFI